MFALEMVGKSIATGESRAFSYDRDTPVEERSSLVRCRSPRTGDERRMGTISLNSLILALNGRCAFSGLLQVS